MNKFRRSWLLFKSSVRVIFQYPKLLLFPILSFCLTILLVLFFIVPVTFQKTGYSLGQAQHWEAVKNSLFVEKTTVAEGGGQTVEYTLKPAAYGLGIAFYFLTMFLATFVNVAFFSEILGALKGDPVSIGQGFAFACTRWRAILMWTLFAGIIGLLIRMLEEKLEWIGRFIVRLIGIAWSVASVFAIPVLVCDESANNPLAVLRKSALTLKETWGESLIGYAGVQLSGLLILLGSLFGLGGALAVSILLNNYWIMAVAGVLWLLSIIALAYLTNVASQVYRCALFMYATERVIPEPYNQDLLEMAWKRKAS